MLILLAESRDDMIKPNNLLLDALKKEDNLFGKVRQTADAALDSRFLVNASELASKKLNNSLQGGTGVGIDIDQFVSRCIYFMKSGGSVLGEEGAPAIAVPENEDDDVGDDGLDWAVLGRHACFPCNRRPPTSSFLLGPLSVQKRVRTTQKKVRSQRQPVGPATRPQGIKEGDMQQSENTNLSNLVKSINTTLRKHIETVDDKVNEELSEIQEEDIEQEDIAAAARRYRGAAAPTQELAVSLLDFAINPHDFGQTVENLFYISFLVREGNAKILKDEDGLPLLSKFKSTTLTQLSCDACQHLTPLLIHLLLNTTSHPPRSRPALSHPSMLTYPSALTRPRDRSTTRSQRPKKPSRPQYRLFHLENVHTRLQHHRTTYSASRECRC